MFTWLALQACFSARMDVTGEGGVADLNPSPVTDFDASGLDPRPVDKGAVATAQVLDVVLSLCWKQ